MGDIYPLWAASSLSDDERANLRERVESAPERPASPPPKIELEELTDLAQGTLYGVARLIESVPGLADPRFFVGLSRLQAALERKDEGLIRAEMAALDVAATRIYGLLPFLLRFPLRQLPLREVGPPPSHAAALLAAIGRARRSGYLPDDDNLQERCEILLVSAQSRDPENLSFALEAVEDRLIELVGGSGPGDLPPAAEARLAVPRPGGQ
jgi:hypothetical protein